MCLPVSAWALEHPADDEKDEDEEIVVRATRTGRRAQDEPIRVEVINREEIEEKVLMAPGNVAMLVSETSGVRVQVTSPALGASKVRVQRFKGRYTQVLAEGLPLYGGQAPSIGLLQIRPTISAGRGNQGAASALYGPSALGGIINLVSRRPGAEPQGKLLLVTSRNGQDVAEAHLLEVDRKLADLTALRRELTAVIDSCDGGSVTDCRIIEALAR